MYAHSLKERINSLNCHKVYQVVVCHIDQHEDNVYRQFCSKLIDADKGAWQQNPDEAVKTASSVHDV